MPSSSAAFVASSFTPKAPSAQAASVASSSISLPRTAASPGAAEAAASLSYEQTQAAYSAGASSFFEALQAQLQLAEARRARVDADAQFLDALWRLERAAPGALPALHPLDTPDVEILDDTTDTDTEEPTPGARDISTRTNGQ